MSAETIHDATQKNGPTGSSFLRVAPPAGESEADMPSAGAAPCSFDAAAAVAALRDLARSETPGLSDDARLRLISQLEDLQSVAWAAQARLCTDFDASQRQSQREARVPSKRVGRAVSDDLATARRESPFRSSTHLACARALVEMPHTYAAVVDGDIKPRHAQVITQATTCLAVEDRATVDAELVGKLAGASDRKVKALVNAATYAADPAGYVRRRAKAAQDRGVWTRPHPEFMATLTILLPTPLAIALYATLRKAAVAAKARGDRRSLNQLMADIAYARISGDHAPGDDTATGPGPDIEIGLVMTDATLFRGDPVPADLVGHGPIPAETARDLLRNPQHDAPGATGGTAATNHPGTTPAGHSSSGPGHSSTPEPDTPGQGNAPPSGDAPDQQPTVDHRDTRPAGQTDQDDRPTSDNEHLCEPGSPGDQHPRSSSDPGTAGDQHTRHSSEPDPVAYLHPRDSSEPGRITRDTRGQTDAGGSSDKDPDNPSSTLRTQAKVWIRRLYADPTTGQLIHRDTTRRLFTGALRDFLIARDQYCSTPWCGAPIAHIDHHIPHRDGGPTDETNGRGLCARCNLHKEHPRHTPTPDPLPAPEVIPGITRRTP